MKKYLSLLGTIALIVSSTTTSILAFSPLTSNSETKDSELDYEIILKEFVDNYYKESFEMKELIDLEMELISSQTNLEELENLVFNSQLSFINQNKNLILKVVKTRIYLDQIEQYIIVAQNIDVDFSTLKKVFNIGLTDSNDRTVTKEKYGPSKWWKVYEWGMYVHFAEGCVNVARTINIIFNSYKVFNAKPLRNLLKELIDFTDFILNMKEGKDNEDVEFIQLAFKVESLENKMEESKLPFQNDIKLNLKIIKQYALVYQDLKGKEGFVKLKKRASKNGWILETELLKYNQIFENSYNYFKNIDRIIKSMVIGIPIGRVSYVVIKKEIRKMVEADINNNGVILKLSQFFIPAGWSAK